MTRLTRAAIAFALSLVAALAVAQIVGFSTSELTIETRAGASHRFKVELALTPEQQRQGLMFRPAIAPDEGMLFVYPVDQPLAMWMRNTLVSLDILFLKADGTIINIHPRATPHSTATLPSDGPARGALELAAGTAERLSIRPGDRVVHRLLAAGR